MLGRVAKKGRKAKVKPVPKRYQRYTEKAARTAAGSSGCETIVYKRRCKGSKRLGTHRCRAIKPIEVVRCASEKGRFFSSGFKSKQRAHMKKTVCWKRGKGKQKLFARCPAGKKAGSWVGRK